MNPFKQMGARFEEMMARFREWRDKAQADPFMLNRRSRRYLASMQRTRAQKNRLRSQNFPMNPIKGRAVPETTCEKFFCWRGPPIGPPL